MSALIEELLASFRSSSQKLKELGDELNKLQDAKNSMTQLSSNLNSTIRSFDVMTNSHRDFLVTAQITNSELGKVIEILQNLDTKSINLLLTRISNDIEKSEEQLSKVVNTVYKIENNLDIRFEKLSEQQNILSQNILQLQKDMSLQVEKLSAYSSQRHEVVKRFLFIFLIAFMLLIANVFHKLPI